MFFVTETRLWDRDYRRRRDRCNFCCNQHARLLTVAFFKEKVAQLFALDLWIVESRLFLVLLFVFGKFVRTTSSIASLEFAEFVAGIPMKLSSFV